MSINDPTIKYRTERHKKKRQDNGEERRYFWIKDIWRPEIQAFIDKIRQREKDNEKNHEKFEDIY